MPIVNRLESRLGHLAIPGIIQFFAGLQLVSLVLLYFMPEAGQEAFLRNLILIREKVFQGEIWRLITHMFVPRIFNPFFALIAALFAMFIGRGLDEAWGAFRVNLYVFGGIAAVTLGSLVFGFNTGSLWIWSSFLFAFAMFYPDREIMLMFVIPIKMKWVALISAGSMAFVMMGNSSQILPIFFAVLPFAIAFGPEFIRNLQHAAKVSERRQRYEAAQMPADDAFHKCTACGKTEHDDRHLEWRIADDDEEYCSACRPLKKSPVKGNG